MTNEIEKKFFDAFGIKAKLDGSDFNKSIQANYPEITNRILLELIEIIIKFDFGIRIDYDADGYGIASENYSGHFEENLKDSVLDYLITNKTQFYHQVRELFGEKEEK